MGAQLRIYRRKIRGVANTQKITRAMELIAASRIVRAQQRVQQSRPYTEQITRAIENIASLTDIAHPLVEERADPGDVAVLVVTSDRGLAGAYSANVLRATEQLLATLREEGKRPRLYVIGRKGVGYFRFREREMTRTWTGFSEQPGYRDAKEVADTLIAAFVEHEVDEIHAVYTDFVTMLTQRTVTSRFLPLVVEETDEPSPHGPVPLYIFEPSPQAVLDALLPRYVESRVFTALLESAASESASRRRAMKAATDNADELIKVYTRAANQARQAEITQEIMEIVGGAEALQKTGSG
ncbi:MAG TPA: F0F1 ATP synthase subunit gamma [Actinomycetes bacterium]|nr:F0F1 ATP synthase subunit gamma [Actinomycetes bacterium]